MKVFADKLKALRKLNNLSLTQLAKELKISVKTLRRYENNYHTRTSVKIVITVAIYFNVG